MPTLLVSVSGIRGIVGDGLTPEVACAFASALGTHLNGGSVLVSRDSRPSGVPLRHAVIAGLTAAGCDVTDVGVAPTPTAGRAVRQLGCAGGVQITASHNPSEWNGLKMFGPDGAVLTIQEGQQVRELYESRQFKHATWDRVGRESDGGDVGGEHLSAVLDLIEVAKVKARRFRVLLDANGGAGGPLALRLLDALGCDVTPVGCEPDGRFAHDPEPTPKSLAEVAELAKGHDVGFALDPDADRLALIKGTGSCISEELTLALAASFALKRRPGPVVINMSTSRVIEDVCEIFGCRCERSAVGEANVVARMRQCEAAFGGEGNGGVIDPRVGWVRDPYVGMAMILNLLADGNRSLADHVADLPRYVMRKTKVRVERGRLAEMLARLKEKWPDARADETDGLRFDWPDRWLHVRASNTEPVVRVIAEAAEESDVRELIGAVAP